MKAEALMRTVVEIENRLVWMDPVEMEIAGQDLTRMKMQVADLNPKDRQRIASALEGLRRALAFAHEVFGKRLEAVSSGSSLYDCAGTRSPIHTSELEITG